MTERKTRLTWAKQPPYHPAMRSLWLPVVLLTLLAGCGADRAAPGVNSTVRDSAGIPVVFSTAPRDSNPSYRADPTPVLDLGGGTDLADEFSGTVIALPMSDGRLVVANAGTSEIRFFDRTGQRIGSFGRKGSGPGEFERIASMLVGAGDSVLVFDQGTRRLTVIGPTGTLIRTGMIALEQGTEATGVIGLLAGGGLVVRPAGGGQAPSSSGAFRDSVDLQVVHPDGRQTLVGRFPGREAGIDIGTQAGQIVSVNIAEVPFGRASLFATSDTAIVFASSDRYEFELYDRSGHLLRRVSRRHLPEPITPADLTALVTAAAIPNADARTRYQSSLEKAAIPAAKPAYDRVLSGANGELWFRDYLGPYHRIRPSHWSVFDHTGAWLSTVELPTGFAPTWIGPDQILGTWLDPDDAPHVRLYHLTHP